MVPHDSSLCNRDFCSLDVAQQIGLKEIWQLRSWLYWWSVDLFVFCATVTLGSGNWKLKLIGFWRIEWSSSFVVRLFPSCENPAEVRSNSKTVAVSFELEWTAITKQFDFDTDLHPSALADAIAREPWTRTFFDNLRMLVRFWQY